MDKKNYNFQILDIQLERIADKIVNSHSMKIGG